MHIDTLLGRVIEYSARKAIVGEGVDWSYARLQQGIEEWHARFAELDLKPGELIAVRSDFRAEAIACLLALLQHRAVAVMMSPADPGAVEKGSEIGVRLTVEIDREERFEIHNTAKPASTQKRTPHPLIQTLLDRGHPGFVVFSSGSSGSPKAVLHDADGFCAHLVDVRKAKSTVGFLALDHIAGVDTLLYTLFAGGSLVPVSYTHLTLPTNREV